LPFGFVFAGQARQPNQPRVPAIGVRAKAAAANKSYCDVTSLSQTLIVGWHLWPCDGGCKDEDTGAKDAEMIFFIKSKRGKKWFR
jgi:hypothetical protein